MNNTQWDRLKLAHHQSNIADYLASKVNLQSAHGSNGYKYVGPNNRLLSIISDTRSDQKVIRHLRIYCKTTFEFIEEITLEETNKKYLCRIFGLTADDKLLLSYRVSKAQQKYMKVLSGRAIDLNRFDYFMETPVSNCK